MAHRPQTPPELKDATLTIDGRQYRVQLVEEPAGEPDGGNVVVAAGVPHQTDGMTEPRTITPTASPISPARNRPPKRRSK